MKGLCRRVSILVLVVVAGFGTARADELRGVALVIGQADYETLNDLGNPLNDARAMDDMLTGLGFDVTRVLDRGGDRLRRAIEDFVDDAADADVALVYYAGHAVEAGGRNFLVPVDADLASGTSLIAVSEIVDELARRVPVTILLLDACRTEAFPDGTMLLLPGGDAPVAVASSGLGEMRGPTPILANVPPESLGMVIGFAAAPGQAALDGPAGGNSPYATALLKHFSAGGYAFGDLMTMVTEEVYLRTGAKQVPWTNSSLRRVLSFGTPVETTDDDEALIRDGRRKLLLSIAATPADIRQQVESTAASADVPMDTLYGLLDALGAEAPSDPAELDRLLTTQTETLRKIMAERTALTTTDPEILRLAELAQRAFEEGLVELRVRYWEEANARLDALDETLDATEAALEARRREQATAKAELGDSYLASARYADAAAAFGEAFDKIARWDDRLAVDYKHSEASALQAHGDQRGDNDALERSIAAYRVALSLVIRADAPDDWAALQNDLGNTLHILGGREHGTARLEEAAIALRAALEEWTRERVPLHWATAQNNLGNVFQTLARHEEGTARLEDAVIAYRAALDARTREQAPLLWARTQSNLGSVLHSLGHRENNTVRLEGAVAAYRLALEELTRERVPLDWAATQTNLGSALHSLGARETGTARLAEAVAAHRAALEERIRERIPLTWALVQANLGDALQTWGERESGTTRLEEAVIAYRAALEERTRERVPLDWSRTQSDLADALATLGGRESGTTHLEEALTAYRAALEEWTREAAPRDWAVTQNALSTVLLALAERLPLNERPPLWVDAIVALRHVTEVYSREGAPSVWTNMQNTIGYLLVLLGEAEDDVGRFEEAVQVLRGGLAVQEAVDPGTVPFTQDSLCRALLGLGSRTGDRQMLLDARALCETALAGELALGASSAAAETEANLAAIDEALAALG